MRHIETEEQPPEAGEPAPGAPHGAGTREERLQKALDLAYAYVNPRDRTVSEVRLRLERRGMSQELAEDAITILGEQGFLDDARYARLFVADKRTLDQWGGERIRRGLLSRGVDRALVEATLAQEPDPDGEEPETELERALALLRRRFPEPPQDRRDRNRALGMLLRKGYESELALDALSAHARGD